MTNEIQLENFLSEVTGEAFIVEVVKRVKRPLPEVQALIHTYVNEARFGYTLIEPYLTDDIRLLEVGAGVGILSACLQLSGYEVTGIEPSGPGFDLCYVIGQEIRSILGIEVTGFVNLAVEDLHKSTLGQFDLIYSVNVLEHLPNLDSAFLRMQSVLAPQGLMVHTCPNYHIPYEPHFGVMLVPFFPLLSKFILSQKITDTALWQSLNFITSTGMKRICKRNGLHIIFEPEVMYRTMQRMGDDYIFAERHQGIINYMYRFLSVTGLIYLLKIWPPIFSTPMIFVSRQD